MNPVFLSLGWLLGGLIVLLLMNQADAFPKDIWRLIVVLIGGPIWLVVIVGWAVWLVYKDIKENRNAR